MPSPSRPGDREVGDAPEEIGPASSSCGSDQYGAVCTGGLDVEDALTLLVGADS